MLIWLLLHSLGAGLAPDNTCTFNRDDGSGSLRVFLLDVRVRLLLLMRVMLLIGGSLPTFLFLHAFVLVPGWLMLLARLLVSPFGLHVGWILLIGLLHLRLVSFRMSGMFIEMFLGLFLKRLFVPLRDAASRSAVDDFWSMWTSKC